MPAHKSVSLKTPGLKPGDAEILLSLPTVGLGTWKSSPGEVGNAVEIAIRDAGYRHIDTATAYGNEKEVGDAIRAAGVKREEIFLTTKLNNPDMGDVEGALKRSLKSLDCGYIDLWLMHWPAPMTADEKADKSIDWRDTWKEMERVYNANRSTVKAIGVSNFSLSWLKELLSFSTITPAANQIELHPWCMQQELVDFCASKGIVVEAYSPLGSGHDDLLKDPVVLEIQKKHAGADPANILISLQANRPNVVVLPKSVTEKRIKSNATVLDLDTEDIKKLTKLNDSKQYRVCDPGWTGWGGLGFEDCPDEKYK